MKMARWQIDLLLCILNYLTIFVLRLSSTFKILTPPPFYGITSSSHTYHNCIINTCFFLKRQFILPECILDYKCIMSLFFEWWLSHRYSSQNQIKYLLFQPRTPNGADRFTSRNYNCLIYKIRTCTPYINATIMLNYTVMYNIIWQGLSVHNLHTFRYYFKLEIHWFKSSMSS